MTDTSAPQPPSSPASGNAQAAGPQLRALSQFAKDLSFENPGNVPGEDRPNIDLGIDVSATPHEQGNGIYEVSLKLTAKAHTPSTTLFLLELDYGGLFQIVGMSEEESEFALLVECPRLLFPFARRLIADVTREGGFPPLLIDPVDFVQLYRQQAQSRAGQAANATAPSQPTAAVPPTAPVPPAAPVQPAPAQPAPVQPAPVQPAASAPAAAPAQPTAPAAPAPPGQPGQPPLPPGTGQGS